MKTGFAQVPITPGRPCVLAGYYKSRPAAGVHDEVYVRALVFPGPVVILSLDILNADRLSMDRILRALAPLGIGEDQLLVTAVHTHSSFGGIFDTSSGLRRELRIMFGETDEALLAMLAERCAAAVKEAMADMAETRIRFIKGSIEGLGTNRHSPELPHDRDLFLIEFFRAGGRKILLYNLSCHPTVLNGENLLISADLSGAVASRLGGVYDMVVFVNGSAGDVSTRFIRRESSFAECDRLGALAAGRITELTEAAGAAEAGAETLDRVELTYHRFCLSGAAVEGIAAAEAKLAAAQKRLDAVKASSAGAGEIRRIESLAEAALISVMKAKAAAGRPAGDVDFRTGILSINRRKILCVPLELFSVLALKLKSRFPAEGERMPVEIFGYVNAVEGYLADAAAHGALDYEALFSPFAAGEGERYIELLCSLLYH
ncbi:MAG: neutral/alkaline non-lysosomal ceramidase N-terminal domain-containing protein [Treponema sp.]|nr:neutral/alkaline non-lysosomal ceramidase N-terminal domain-containing protein [Treponema sp.]